MTSAWTAACAGTQAAPAGEARCRAGGGRLPARPGAVGEAGAGRRGWAGTVTAAEAGACPRGPVGPVAESRAPARRGGSRPGR
ncbi:hypothetical protein SHJGH_2341 [Streptomyces hygroscopicus subsp. jinggangensis TL01]|nr:hypothetical protein SHJGH_2341 [Streptomyces hygroscopicus subsp. jinggangensis TL01]